VKILATSNHGNTFNPKEGADVRKYNLLMELAKSNDVCVLESNRYQNDKSKVPSNIKIEYFHEINLYGYPLSFLLDFNPSYIFKLISIMKKENFEIIQISFCNGIIITKLITLLMNKNIKIIYDAHNVEAEIIFQVSNKNCSLFLKYFFWIYVPLIEKLAITAADDVICVSETDKLSFIKRYNLPLNKITVIPSGTKIRPLNLEKNNKKKLKEYFNIKENEIVILFHGTYKYPPNRKAIDIIINYIAPIIETKFKNAVFLLAGNGVPTFEKDNIKSVGFIENLDSLLSVSDIAIVPILSGGGTRLKILDYMSVGLPIVSTKKGIEGIEVVEGKDAIVCEGVNEKFIEGILDMLYKNEQRVNIGVNAYELAKKKYDWEEIGKKLHRLYTDLISA
jgi:glycosyltransferase involved in cell wall biosynthesis